MSGSPSPSPSSKTCWSDHWPDFVERLEERLAEGHRQYGDWSFNKPHSLLVADLAEELLDIVGWGFILHCRLMELSKQLDDLLGKAAEQVERVESD